MAKRNNGGDSELNLDSLMDAVTNVVGVLMIVFVMMSLNTARTLQKILSDLPPVTKEQHEEMKKKVDQLPPLAADPKKLEEQKKLAEQELKKAAEQLQSVDTTEMQSRMKFMDLDTFRKKLEEAKKDKDKQKAETEKLLTEVERLKALLDQTPVIKPEPPTYVRLPNPRPFPKEPNEMRVIVAKQGVLLLNEKEFIKPVIEGLDKIRSQFEYKEVKIDPFAKMLTEVFGNAQAAQAAWPELAPLVNTFQLDQVAMAYKILSDAKVPTSRQVLTAIGSIALVTRSSLPTVATAILEATKGDFTKWLALDPSRDPAKPIIKAVAGGGKATLGWGSKVVEIKFTPREILDYFVKELADMDSFKNAVRQKTIYDAFKLANTLERAAASPMMNSLSYTFKPEVKPGSSYVQLQWSPKAGGGETLEQIRSETSVYQRTLRQLKLDPKAVAIFQVRADAYSTYLEARQIADQIGVPATWEFLDKLELTTSATPFEVQRFAKTLPNDKKDQDKKIRIAAPKRALD